LLHQKVRLEDPSLLYSQITFKKKLNS